MAGAPIPPESVPTVARPACPSCGGQGLELRSDLRDRRFGVPGTWRLVGCSSPGCDACWLDPTPRPEALGRLYVSYYTHSGDGGADGARTGEGARSAPGREVGGAGSRWGRLARRLRDWDERSWPTPAASRAARAARRHLLPAGRGPGRVLEVGCGDGVHLAELARQGWDVVGQEIDPVAAMAAQRRVGVPIHVGSLADCPFAAGDFDAVLLHHVIEHLDDPGATLDRIRTLLRPDGVLAVFTPNSRAAGARVFKSHWRGLEPPRHLALYGPASLRRILSDHGFDVPSMYTQSHLAAFMAIESVGDALARWPRILRAAIARPASLAFHGYARRCLARDPEQGEELVAIGCRSDRAAP